MFSDREMYIDNDKILDKIIRAIINSNDLNFKKTIGKKIIQSLINRERIRYGLDFDLEFVYEKSDISGSYNKRSNLMQINLDFLDDLENFNYYFVTCIESIFHEVRHAVKCREVQTGEMLDFDKLIMSIDMLMSDVKDCFENLYYDNNGNKLSFEIDATKFAYRETSQMFKEYPELIKRYEQEVEKDNYVRKDVMGYYDIIFLFVKKMNYLLKSNPGFYRAFDDYPVFKEFFDIDKKGINFKSVRYFIRKKRKINSEKDSVSKTNRINSIQMFLREMGIFNYLESDVTFFNETSVLEAISDYDAKVGSKK